MREIARSIQERTLPEYDVMRLFGPFLESVKPGGQILDLGAGYGVQAEKAAGRGMRVIAVDKEERPLTLTSEAIEWLTSSVEAYIESLNPDQSFDGALLQNIIHFFPKDYVLKTLLPVIFAHLKPGACLAIETMSAPPEPALKKFQTYYSPEELTAILSGEVLLAEKNDSQRLEDDRSLRTFHHTRVMVRRGAGVGVEPLS